MVQGLEQKMIQFIEEHQLIQQGQRVLVACSGGVDSMLLLTMLHRVKQHLGIEIAAAHVDHMLRGEASAEDGRMVQQYCEEKGIPYYSGAVPIPKLLAQSQENVQQLCRQERYRFLEGLMQSKNYDALATAHHGEDQLETILIQMTKGRALLGMPIKRALTHGTLIRPLLFVDKETIYTTAHDEQIPYREDGSNATDDYMRNRYRHHIIPQMKIENPSVVRSVSTIIHQAQADEIYLQKLAKEALYKNLKKTSEGYPMMDVSAFQHMSSALQRRVIPLLLNYLYHKEHPIFYKAEMMEQILQHLQKDEGNISIDLPEDYQFVREYNLFFFQQNQSNPCVEKILHPGHIVNWNHQLWLYWNRIEDVPNEVLSEAEEITFFHISKNLLPLKARHKKDGDRIALKGMKGKKKVARLFIDEKVGRTLREKLPIIVTKDDQVCAIPTLRYGCDFTSERHANSTYIFVVGQKRL